MPVLRCSKSQSGVFGLLKSIIFPRAMAFILITVAYGKTMIAGIAGMLLAQ